MLRFIEHQGESIVVEIDGVPHTLTRRLKWHYRPGLFLEHEVQRWALDDLRTLRLSRPILKLLGVPVGGWKLRI